VILTRLWNGKSFVPVFANIACIGRWIVMGYSLTNA
jgi:hypothetical protein